MEYTFKIIVEECEEGGYYAECPAFQGCHVEGDTYEETIREMRNALAGVDKKLPTIDQIRIAHKRISDAVEEGYKQGWQEFNA